jgi:tRNA(Ile)-lysidine synthase
VEAKKETYVVAVSGGIDSVVLLDMLSKLPQYNLVVAHFDHGIRQESMEDARFVRELAEWYGLPFETKRVVLGANASEETARKHRYEFLRDVAKKHNGKIVTAHHADDIIETIAINYVRGTGWRGLAVLDSDIVRPLLSLDKKKIAEYAKRNNLTWQEDSTNASDAYLRNRIRHKSHVLTEESKQKVLDLHDRQLALKHEIDREVESLLEETKDKEGYSRYFFIHVDPKPALALLRHITDGHLTRPQLERALLTIKTAQHQTRYHAGKGVELRFTPRHFTVELLK